MKKLICGILMLGTIAGVYGQKVMSLEECRLLALENNKKLKMADEQINAAKAKKEEAFTKYLPALDAMGTYMRNQKEINLLSEDAHLPVGTIGQDGINAYHLLYLHLRLVLPLYSLWFLYG